MQDLGLIESFIPTRSAHGPLTEWLARDLGPRLPAAVESILAAYRIPGLLAELARSSSQPRAASRFGPRRLIR